ncbi:MAG: hypothetical protein NT076_04765 [Candidatus Pacearchaeota archaeon]|nr:hypothetical protein [Candidatus Pacearchaeota archaeon]
MTEIKKKYELLVQTGVFRIFVIYPAILLYGLWIIFSITNKNASLNGFITITAVLCLIIFILFFFTPDKEESFRKMVRGSNKVNGTGVIPRKHLIKNKQK